MKVRDGAIVPHDDDIDFSGLYDKESLDDFWANDFDKFAAALRQLGLQAHRLSSVWIKIAVLYDGADVPWQRKLNKRWSARCVNQVRFAPKSYNRSFSAFSCDFKTVPNTKGTPKSAAICHRAHREEHRDHVCRRDQTIERYCVSWTRSEGPSLG